MFVKHKKDLYVIKSKIYRYLINAALKRSNFNGSDVNCENKKIGKLKKNTFVAKQRTLKIKLRTAKPHKVTTKKLILLIMII